MKLTPKLALAIGALAPLLSPAAVLAQNAPAASFAQVTAAPIPLHSVSGRFSSLNPVNQQKCSYSRVSGRVLSPRLILVKDMSCGRPGHDNVLVNVLFSNPADAAQMITGRRVTIAGSFKHAEEDRDPVFVAEFLIADNARFVSGDRLDASAPAFTSYMMCQPPELDALASKLGHDLCVQSTIVADLAGWEPSLEAAARTPAKLAPEETAPGDANAISCRLDPGVSDRQLPAIACARNSYWAWYKAKWGDPLDATLAPA